MKDREKEKVMDTGRHAKEEKRPTRRSSSKEQKIKELEEKLKDKTTEAQANYDKFLRACAEFENFKKRLEKEKKDLVRFSNEELVKELLSVIDNLERALDRKGDTENVKDLRDGVNLTLQQLLKTLNKFGLEQVSALGERFDPNKHEAIAIEESQEHDEGVVVNEIQKAYFFKDRLLRPALVSVSGQKKPAK